MGKEEEEPNFEELLEQIKSEEKDVRITAAFALGKLGDKRATEPLQQLRKKEERSFDIYILQDIEEALMKLEKVEYIKDEIDSLL